MTTAPARFWKYVDRRGTDECWPWKGSRMVRGGYGQLNDRGRLLKAHRLSYEIHRGSIPDGNVIRHKCNNPPCVNPNHLVPGTHADNHRDMRESGRAFVPESPRGEAHHSAKLDAEKVRAIRSSKAASSHLAKKFGVSRQSIYRIRKGISWKKI